MMTTQKLILTILSGLAGFIILIAFLYFDYKLAGIILIAGLLLAVIYLLTRQNMKMMGMMAERENQLYNRNMYLTDVLLKQEPSLAHALNQVPPPMSEAFHKSGTMSLAGMDDVPYEEV